MSAEPVRTCTGCRVRRPQGELIRVAVAPDGTVAPDEDRRSRRGRGAYVCPDPRCIDRAVSGGLRRALRLTGPLPEGLRAELLAEVEGS